ncbi:LysM peptidoglycan-binding domain-containing protein [Mesobacillus subterraneus]|uniref:Peptidoglycan endopeptidase n=1 Tax=Mesobacillus subterraneus TaxID=285983 RepID=A0A3R9FFT8_9BACI|nr:C40 family peptidase [Mesobacillus subterraneus]RSD27064.1 peptidoglycan endopeptidase [Mesobacillus subterraneus]
MKKQAASFVTAAILSSAFAGIASADTYTVKKGDTLSHIAFTYKTSVLELKKTNKLTSDLIYANQKLTVPSAGSKVTAASVKKTTAAKTTAPAKTSAPAQKTTAQAATYVVKSGDTLSKIASKHKIKLNDLMKWNGLKNHLIYPGQKLKVSNGTSSTTASKKETDPAQKPASKPAQKPAASAPAKPTQTPAVKPAPAPAPAQPAKPAATPVAQIEYVVKSGDTLSKISLQFGMTVQQLKDVNKLTSDLIFVGQKLMVTKPADSPAAVTTPTSPPTGTQEPAVISFAKEVMGVPYVWAGSTPEGFDCSGFIYYAFNKAGKQMGRYSSEGYYSRSFYVNDPQPGDLVFFENTYKPGISHMGIYLGNNEFIHASTTGGVMISNLSETYYAKHFEGFKRFY